MSEGKAQGATTLTPAAPANDNTGDTASDTGGRGDSSAIQVTCDLPDQLGILPSEAELIARFLPDLLKAVANDNETE